jgi:serine protease
MKNMGLNGLPAGRASLAIILCGMILAGGAALPVRSAANEKSAVRVASPSKTPEHSSVAPGRLIIGLHPIRVSIAQTTVERATDPRSVASLRALNRAVGVKSVKPLYPPIVGELTVEQAGTFVLEVNPKSNLSLLAKKYRNDPHIRFAEPDAIATAAFTPNDEHFGRQWNFHNTSSNNSDINLPEAWEYDATAPNYGGDPSVVVAVIDTGVAYENFENFLKAPDFADTAFSAGYDFANEDSHPNDDNAHGTHVAGTIAQSTNNTSGTAGIAFKTTIMPIKALGADGSGLMSNVARGITFAKNNGADVINMSLEGPQTDVLTDAVREAAAANIVMVAATGNSGLSSVSYPAAHAEVIAVGATRYDATITAYSNYGEGIDLVAPGGDLGVDQNNDGFADGILQQTFAQDNPSTSQNEVDVRSFAYYYFQGTSMATPHVAGAAAWLLANRVQPTNVKDLLTQTARDLGDAGVDSRYGYGLLDLAAAAAAALGDSTPPSGSIAIENGAQRTSSASPTLTLSATDTGGTVRMMALSNNGSNFAAYETYSTSKTWNMTDSATGGTSSEGIKYVCVKYKDLGQNESPIYCDSIFYDGNIPTPPVIKSYGDQSETISFTSGTRVADGSPYFKWTGSSDAGTGVAGYYVYFGTDANADPHFAGDFQASDTFTVSGLSSDDVVYYLRVQAADASDNVSTISSFSLRLDNVVARPTNVAVSQTARGLRLRWTPSSDNHLLSHRIYRSTTSTGPYPYLKDIPAGTNTYEDREIVRNQDVFYVVSAVDTNQMESTLSPEIAGKFSAAVYLVASMGTGGEPLMKILTSSGAVVNQFYAYATGFRGGVQHAVYDLNGDGNDEIITAAGPGGGPHVRIFNKLGQPVIDIDGFMAYAASYKKGVNVAAGDVNGDGFGEIVTGTMEGGGPHVRVFSRTGQELASFFPYPSGFRGGVRVAVGDVNGDGIDEIITAAGPGGGPHVRIYNGNGSLHHGGFLAYASTFRGGVTVGAGDINEDGKDEIITGVLSGGGPQVRIFNRTGGTVGTPGFMAYASSLRNGVVVATGDFDQDGREDIVTGTGPGGGPQVRFFNEKGATVVSPGFFAFDQARRTGLLLSSGIGLK